MPIVGLSIISQFAHVKKAMKEMQTMAVIQVCRFLLFFSELFAVDFNKDFSVFSWMSRKFRLPHNSCLYQ